MDIRGSRFIGALLNGSILSAHGLFLLIYMGFQAFFDGRGWTYGLCSCGAAGGVSHRSYFARLLYLKYFPR